jgi:hypothetical protein
LSRVFFLRVSTARIAREYFDDGPDDLVSSWEMWSMAGMIDNIQIGGATRKKQGCLLENLDETKYINK